MNGACRIDCFSEVATSAFGEKMKEQVEERLRFYDEGIAPQKNITAMQVSKSPRGAESLCKTLLACMQPVINSNLSEEFIRRMH